MKIQHITVKHTRYYIIETEKSIIAFDVAWPGMLYDYLRAIKQAGIDTKKLKAFIVSHFHIDHAGIAGELTQQGLRLGLLNTQTQGISELACFMKKKSMPYTEIKEDMIDTLTEENSRNWLAQYGVQGTICSTPLHSPDSISLVLDSGECLVGDMTPVTQMMRGEKGIEYWDMLLEKGARKILHAHAEEYSI